jgi:hypothetical protein
MAEIIYLDERRPFNINEEPCSKCPIQEGCCTTCEKAIRWFNQLAERLKGK